MLERWLVAQCSLLSHQLESKKQGSTSGCLLYYPTSTSTSTALLSYFYFYFYCSIILPLLLFLLVCCSLLTRTVHSLHYTLLRKYNSHGTLVSGPIWTDLVTVKVFFLLHLRWFLWTPDDT